MNFILQRTRDQRRQRHEIDIQLTVDIKHTLIFVKNKCAFK